MVPCLPFSFCVHDQKTFSFWPHTAVLICQVSLLCFLIQINVLHIFWSVTVSHIPTLSSPTPNLSAMHVHLYGASITIWWPVVLQNLSKYNLLCDTIKYFIIWEDTALPCSSLPPLFLLSISAGYNPCWLCSVDRSLLSANYSSYLTSEV